jgi:flagellar hook-basal body complex protein FliE
VQSGTKAGGVDFGEALARAGAAIVEPEREAAAAVQQFENGRRNIHETLLAIEKADISFKYMMNIRNKLLDAYKEVMAMGA